MSPTPMSARNAVPDPVTIAELVVVVIVPARAVGVQVAPAFQLPPVAVDVTAAAAV